MRLFKRGKMVLYSWDDDSYYTKGFHLYKPVWVTLVLLTVFFLCLLAAKKLGS